MEIRENWFVGENIYRLRSPNIGDYFKPDTIVFHYTAGGTAEGAVSHLVDPKTEVSAHLVISRDLRIFQLVPFNRIAWHAGKSKWKDRENLNRYSIGIEIDNAGKLDLVDGRYYSWFGREYAPSDVVAAKHQNSSSVEFWHKYDDLQIELCTSICKSLIEELKITEIVGHDEIAPDRKIDPGPAFPIDVYRRLLP